MYEKYLWMWSTMFFKQTKIKLQKWWSHLHTLMKWLSTLLFEFWKVTIYVNKSCAGEHDAKSAASNSKIWFGGNVNHCYFCVTLYDSPVQYSYNCIQYGVQVVVSTLYEYRNLYTKKHTATTRHLSYCNDWPDFRLRVTDSFLILRPVSYTRTVYLYMQYE